jgi:hypothetical protein
MQPGDYGKYEGVWYCRPPWKHALGNLAKHQVEEHEDGTITVSPSILIKCGGDIGEWHGYLRKGVWDQLS